MLLGMAVVTADILTTAGYKVIMLVSHRMSHSMWSLLLFNDY